MKIIFNTLLFSTLLFSSISHSFADDFAAVQSKLEIAMKAPVRTEAETKRDHNRKPVETLKFFGLRDDMTVIELIPGGGWYTKLLAPVLADKGQLYVALGTEKIEKNLLNKEGFSKVSVIAKEAKLGKKPDARLYFLELSDLGIKNADIVFTFRNYHNFDFEGRMAMNRAAFSALKPGGTYALVDHTQRHMEADTPENRRRFDPVVAIKEIQAAGFVFEDSSDLHYRADDELRYEVGRKSVTGNSDRWTLKFRKPE